MIAVQPLSISIVVRTQFAFIIWLNWKLPLYLFEAKLG